MYAWEGMYDDWKNLSARGLGELTPHIRKGAYGWYAASYGKNTNRVFETAADAWCSQMNKEKEEQRIAKIRNRIWSRPGQFIKVPAPPRKSFWSRWFG